MENIKKENHSMGVDVACVGILVADVLAKPMDSVPEEGLLAQVDSIEMFSGGNAMTASINLKKMGISSAVVGKIGADPFGEFLKGRLIKDGVNVQGLSIDENVQTSTSVVLSNSDGERTFLHCVGANGVFSIDDIDFSIIEQAKLVFLTGTFLLDTFDGPQTTEFLKRCKKMGKITALDVCWDSKNNWNKFLKDAYPYIDIFLPSISEAEKLSGIRGNLEEIANFFLAGGVNTVIIKLGKYGALLKESIEAASIIMPTYKNVKVVDTTGAGDSFCAGFLAAYIKGENLVSCLKFANAVGTHCVMAKGATTGIKSYEEIENFISKNELEF